MANLLHQTVRMLTLLLTRPDRAGVAPPHSSPPRRPRRLAARSGGFRDTAFRSVRPESALGEGGPPHDPLRRLASDAKACKGCRAKAAQAVQADRSAEPQVCRVQVSRRLV